MEIKLNPTNPRFIKDDKFKKLCESIKKDPEFLELRPIVIDKEGIIIGGNMRYRALLELGIPIKDEWVKQADKLTDEQRRKFIVIDNQEFGDNDWDALSTQYDIDELLEWGFDEKDLKIEKEVVEDEAPEVSDEPAVSKLGEVYQLGRHRLMCGDSTSFNDVSLLTGGVQADMVFTDPPYNVDYTGKTKDALKIENDKFEKGGFLEFLKSAFNNIAASVKSGAAIYVCHADSEGLNFRLAFIESGFLLKQCIIWNKNSMVLGRQDYQWKHEPILYGWKDGGSHSWFGNRSETTVWDIDRPSRSSEHPTMKPIALIAKALNNSSKSDDIILDLFLGSGSTLIACEQTQRICYGMELDPKYTDVIRRRYWKFINGSDDGWQENTPKIDG